MNQNPQTPPPAYTAVPILHPNNIPGPTQGASGQVSGPPLAYSNMTNHKPGTPAGPSQDRGQGYIAPPVGAYPATQQPRRAQCQVPREFTTNAEEAHRAARRTEVTRTVVLLHPNGDRVQYARTPVPIRCQFCHSKVVTEVETDCNGGALCLMILLFLICLPIGVCFICSGSFDTYRHRCPVCREEVGSC